MDAHAHVQASSPSPQPWSEYNLSKNIRDGFPQHTESTLTNVAIQSIQKLFAKPTMRRDNAVPTQPINKTGLRPIRSERAPHSMPVKLSARAKAEMRMPA
ncbi:MAG: hypothetical protein Q9160_001326 [Pyrenula sp. 1 TL-2023]